MTLAILRVALLSLLAATLPVQAQTPGSGAKAPATPEASATTVTSAPATVEATPATTIEAVTTTATAVAPAPIAPVLVGNSEEGRLRVYTCTGCHGIAGYRNVYPTYHVPKIHGQNAQYLVTALTAYRTGLRKHPTMQAQGESLSDQDIADIAAYLSSAAKH